ncbi:MAG: transcriptional repressor [Patescibacteria group bacterium]
MSSDFSDVLRAADLRVTKPRLAVLAFLSMQKRPVSLQRIAAYVNGTNLTTVYRMIETFLEKGILRGCDVGHGHMDYELADLPHHHHVICTSCGLIEEVEECSDNERLHKKTLRASRKFSAITDHQSTFYGQCTSCV